MTAYYNENDPKAVLWLKELIRKGYLPKGDVDERSIEDVRLSDLEGYRQHHFFAGIGGWPLALLYAGWPEDRPVWTGSCPCQSFSTAGRRKGLSDKRHLWPVWFNLVRQFQPEFVFGEQVEAAIKHGWLDIVQDDLEGEGYTVGSSVLPACSVGAPHIRQRLWFGAVRLANPSGFRFEQQRKSQAPEIQGKCSQREGKQEGPVKDRELPRGLKGLRRDGRADQSDIRWGSADWIGCKDNKFRPVEPGTSPLGDGLPARVGRLRGYGNAIVPQVAQVFVESFVEAIAEGAA